ncbi:7256_t:CDS:2, partial [Racocetra persica]
DFFARKMSELKFIAEILSQVMDILTCIDGTHTNWDLASAASKFRKCQNNNTNSSGNRPDFVVQNYSGYELFALEVAGGPTHNDQVKMENDSTKIGRQMQNGLNYISMKEANMGRPMPANLQIFGASSRKFEIQFKKMTRVGNYVLMKNVFVAEIPTNIVEYPKLKDLIGKLITISNLVDSSLKILQRNSEAITTSPRSYIPIPCQRSPQNNKSKVTNNNRKNERQ